MGQSSGSRKGSSLPWNSTFDDLRSRLNLVPVHFTLPAQASVKFWNNFLNQMAPLLFYSIGGYLVITGDLTLGALTAALAANKDMTSPWKELLDYYQQTQDSKIKYDQVTEQFRPENMLDERLQVPPDGPMPRLDGTITASNLTLVEDGQSKVLDSLNFSIRPGEKIAIVGPTGGGKETLAMILARLYLPSSGRLMLGGHDAATLPEGKTVPLADIAEDFGCSVQDLKAAFEAVIEVGDAAGIAPAGEISDRSFDREIQIEIEGV